MPPSPAPVTARPRARNASAHLAAAGLSLALALVWSFPLVHHLGGSIPGPPGDNQSFLWNDWWMRRVLSSDARLFFTDRLFAPFGVDLTLHTHTALPSFIAATLFGSLPLVVAHNLTLIASLTANGLAAYALAFDRTRDVVASLLGALIFAGSSYLSIHLLGHSNLVNAWGIPLFLLLFLRAMERESLTHAIAASATLVAVAYTDYYYLVYGLVLAVWLFVSDALSPSLMTRRRKPSARFLWTAGSIALIDLASVAAIAVTGGFDARVMGIAINAHSYINLLTLAWIIGAVVLLATFRPAVRLARFDRARFVPRLRLAAAAGLVVLVGIAPLLVRGAALIRSGLYVAPPAFWRSGPPGVDLATLALGNLLNPLTGPFTQRWYERFGIDGIECAAWLGVVPIALFVGRARVIRESAECRRWLWIGLAFFVWSLGPWLRVGGVNTGLLLPQNLFAHVPILQNARIPGRAMVVVLAGISVVCACAVSTLEGRTRRLVVALAIVVSIADFLPAPFPLTATSVPRVYETLRGSAPDDIVCELPFGVQDGFGMTGDFDTRTLLNQTVHEHPMTGGLISRVPASIVARYQEAPVLRSLLRLSAGQGADPADAALSRQNLIEGLGRARVHFVVLNVARAQPPLIDYVRSTLALPLIERDGLTELYGVPAE